MDGASFGRFLLLLVLLAYTGQGVGLVVACGFASRMLAVVVSPVAIAPFIVMTPYAVKMSSVAPYLLPLLYGSPFWVRRSVSLQQRWCVCVCPVHLKSSCAHVCCWCAYC